MIAVRRKKGELPPPPEVIVFKELGFLSKEEKEARAKVQEEEGTSGSDRISRKRKRDKKMEKKAKKLHQKAYTEGKAWADEGQFVGFREASKEVLEFGIMNMKGADKVDALKRYRKQYGPGDKLTRKDEKKNFIPYPEYQEKLSRDLEDTWRIHDQRIDGNADSKIKKPHLVKKQNSKREDDAIWRSFKLHTSDVNRPKLGRYRDGVLKLTKEDVRSVKNGKLNF